jgi:hypothetical protein
MKDSKGHGSNPHSSYVTAGSRKGIMPSRPYRQGTSNEQAAQSLMSGLKSTMVPTHDAMVGAHVQDAFRNAAANGPEHASVGASLRQAAALERDHALESIRAGRPGWSFGRDPGSNQITGFRKVGK